MPMRSPSPGPGYSDPVTGFYSKDRRGDERKRDRDRRERESTDYRKRRDLIPGHDNYRIREPSPPRRDYYRPSYSDHPTGPANYHSRAPFPPSNRPLSHSRHSEYVPQRRSVSPHSHGSNGGSGPSLPHWSSSTSSSERHSSRYYIDEPDRRMDRPRLPLDSGISSGPSYSAPPTGPRHSKHMWEHRERFQYPRREWNSVGSSSRYDYPDHAYSGRSRYSSTDEGRYPHRTEARPEYRDVPYTRPRTPPERPRHHSMDNKQNDIRKPPRDREIDGKHPESYNSVDIKRDPQTAPLPNASNTDSGSRNISPTDTRTPESDRSTNGIETSSSLQSRKENHASLRHHDSHEESISIRRNSISEKSTVEKSITEKSLAENPIPEKSIEKKSLGKSTKELSNTTDKLTKISENEINEKDENINYNANGTKTQDNNMSKPNMADSSTEDIIMNTVSEPSTMNRDGDTTVHIDQENIIQHKDSDSSVVINGTKESAIKISESNHDVNTQGAIFPLNRMETEFYDLTKNPIEERRKHLKYLDLKNPVKSLYQYEFFENNLKSLQLEGSAPYSSMLSHEEYCYHNEEKARLRYVLLRHLWLKECEKLEKEEEDLNESINEKTPAGQEETEPTSVTNAGTQGSPIVSSRRRAGYQRDAVSSEAEFLQILAQLQKEDENDPIQRASLTSAKIPDMIFDADVRQKVMFIDTNEHIIGKSMPYKRLVTDSIDTFSNEEHELFKEAYVTYPKQFGKISKMMGGLRTFNECVVHYYQTKKHVNYKALVAAKNKRSSGRKISNSSSKKKKREKVTTPGGSMVVTETDDMVYTEAESEIDQAQLDQDPFDALATAAASQPKVISEEGDSSDAKRSATPTPMEERIETKKMRLANQRKIAKENGQTTANTELLSTPQPEIAIANAINEETPTTSSRETSAGVQVKSENPVEGESNVSNKASMSSQKDKVSSYWSLHEISTFEKLLETYGTDWEDISRFMPNKSVIMLRNYFAKHAVQRNYDFLVSKAGKKDKQPQSLPTNVLPTGLVKGPSVGYFAPRGKPTISSMVDPKPQLVQSSTEIPRPMNQTALTPLNNTDNPPRPIINPSKRSSLSNILNPINEDQPNDKKAGVTILPPLTDLSDTSDLPVSRSLLSAPLRSTFAPASIFGFPSTMDQFSSCGYDQHPSSRESNERGSRQR